MIDVREPEELELRHYFRVLWRRKLLVGASAVVCVGAALLYTGSQTPMYRASAEVLLQGTVSETIFEPDAAAGQSTDRSRVATEMEVMGSRSVEVAVAEALGHRPKISISQRGATDVVAIQATDPDPEVAANDAQVYAETYVEVRRSTRIEELDKATTQVGERIYDLQVQIDEIQAPLKNIDDLIVATDSTTDREALQAQRDALAAQVSAQLGSLQSRLLTYAENLDQLQVASNLTESGGSQVVSDASVPEQPFSPQPVRNAGLALALGLLLGLLGAFVRDHFDDTVKTKDDLESVTGGVPVLALVPKVTSGRRRRKRGEQLISITAPESPAAEAYRTLRTSLDFVALDGEIGIVQVTSPIPSEGKTTTLSNLAIALAHAGRRVVVVDCDLRRPHLHVPFGLDNKVGLSSVVSGQTSLASALQRVPGETRLWLLASGERPPNPAELLSNPRVGEILLDLREEVDFVLVDSPPVLPVADSVIVAALADAVILVVQANATSRPTAARAFEVLDQVDSPIVGTVLNQVDTQSRYGYAYGYGGSQASSGSNSSNGSNGSSEASGLNGTKAAPLLGSETSTPSSTH